MAGNRQEVVKAIRDLRAQVVEDQRLREKREAEEAMRQARRELAARVSAGRKRTNALMTALIAIAVLVLVGLLLGWSALLQLLAGYL